MSARPEPPVYTTPAGLRFQLLDGDADPEEIEVLGAALDRLAALERGGRPSPWAWSGRPGGGRGGTWASSLRARPQ